MSKQDKATTERNAKTLRELVKRPENKVCADCKRNDPRWASWNIGVFVCIRCSGIHRSMGTHISKVKSVDLDMWTPEQMKNIQTWGNERANRYWEAHLKPGHIPPDHKVESFIRSKYESRRWAMDGPPPTDPSVLDSDAAEAPEATSPASPAVQAPAPAAPAAPVVSAPPTNTTAHARRTQRTLLSADTFTPPPTSRPVNSVPAAAAAPPPPTAQNDLFTLDFTPPTTTQTPSTIANASNKAAKNDILSLYNSAAAVPAHAAAAGGAVPPSTFMGTNGTGLWGVSSGWAPPAPAAGADPWASLASNASAAKPSVAPTTSMAYGSGFGAVAQPPFAAAQSANVWGAPAPPNAHQNATTFDATGVWGNAGAKPIAPTTTNTTAFDLFATTGSGVKGNSGAGNAPKKDDAFGDLWAGFK